MYLDADVLYAYLKETDWLKKYSKIILKSKNLITSTITITELELISKRDFNNNFSNNVIQEILKLKNLKLIDLTQEVLLKATELRVEYKLNIFDAIHAATTIINKDTIISTDHAFDIITELKRKDPRTFNEI